jgi:ubiquinone/menaquinone biosynthesis C-methylase UbiE
MRTNPTADTDLIRAVYDGDQARLYELFMGRQLHVGGYVSSTALADAAGVTGADRGVELCCGSGASMRFLVRMRNVESMVGVELAAGPIDRGRRAVEALGLTDRIGFVHGDATSTGLPDGEADFVWGEDAWVYVPDKEALVAEAARLVKRDGVIAFTDWVEGTAGLSDGEADLVLQALTFPNLQTIDGYSSALQAHGFGVEIAQDTERFGPMFRLYAEMIRSQFAFDALELFDFSTEVLDLLVDQLGELSRLGAEGKLVQAMFVARR